MRFGAAYKIINDSKSGVTSASVKKYRDYAEYVNETVYEERVQIMRVSDFDTIVTQLHIDHPLEDRGAWLEHGKDGKMYVVKCWIEKH